MTSNFLPLGSEIYRFTKQNSLSVMVYHGSDRNKGEQSSVNVRHKNNTDILLGLHNSNSNTNANDDDNDRILSLEE